MLLQIWLYVAISVDPYSLGRLHDYREFTTYLECRQYADEQPHARNVARDCIPAMKDTRRRP